MAKTANQKIYEAAIKHQISLLRFAEGEADRLVALLAASERELLEKIGAAMAAGKDVARMESILQSIQERRAQVLAASQEQLTQALEGLAEAEAQWEDDAIKSAVPIRLELASVPLEQLRAVVQSPISGLKLDGWMNNIAAAEATALQRAVSQTIVQGETIDQLVRRIRGSKERNYEDGILAVTRRNAQALARTAVSHVANGAREQVWEQNSDIVRARRWTSTLDGRTSSICAARDGRLSPLTGKELLPGELLLSPAGAVPPAHFNCRSVMVAVLDGVELAGDRPFVADARVRAEREAAFRAEAKERGVPIKQIRQEWADKHVGRLPAKTTYDEWLRKQPKEFQDEVLGPARAELFRGGMTADRFVDASGKRLTLQQLRAESAGDALAVAQPGVGMKAKALLMKGATDEQTLSAIKAEFPTASTGMNSIKSYKSELKKAGLLDAARETSITPYQSMELAVKGLEQDLTPGLKHAIGGQWAQVVDKLDGAPGAYAHYQAGQGVKLSSQALAALPAEQVNQVLAHELGHLLHKQHGLVLPSQSFANMKAVATFLPDDAKKLYSYYLSHSDELVAEVYAQAISPSTMTSQGLSANAFKQAFGKQIDDVKSAMAKKFPAPSPEAPKLSGAPHLLGEVAGQHKTVGSLAKALIQQGLTDDQVLAGVKAQFPDAKTGMNSISSYKSELKKAGLAPQKGAGPVIQASPEFKPVPLSKNDDLVDLEFKPLQQTSVPKAVPSLGVTASKGKALLDWQVSALDMLNSGLNIDKTVQELNVLYPSNKTLSNLKVSKFKSEWVKKNPGKGFKLEQMVKATDKIQSTNAGKFPGGLPPASPTASAVSQATTAAAPPALYGKPLGPLSSKVYPELLEHAKKGGTFDAKAVELFKKQYGASFDPSKGADLWSLAEWEAQGKPGLAQWEAQQLAAAAVAKAAEVEKAKIQAAKMNELFKPTRPATTPREGLPPPPRYTTDAWDQAVRKYVPGGQLDTSKMNAVNAAQKARGLPELNPQEYSAVRSYTGNAWYRKVNKALRDGLYAADNSLQALVEAAQHGMMKLPKYVGKTNRGMSLHGIDLQQALSVYRPGAIIEENGFVSTSTASGFGGNVKVIVSGKSGVDVAPLSHYGHEAEVLFMPGTRFRVDSAVQGSTGNWTIEMTEI